MAALLTRLFQFTILPLRNEISNLLWKFLSAAVFASLAVFFGVRTGQAIQAWLNAAQLGPEIEIAAFSSLFFICLFALTIFLKKPNSRSEPQADLNKLVLGFLAGFESGLAKQQSQLEETPKKEQPLS